MDIPVEIAQIVFVGGRIIFGIFFLINGAGHFFQLNMMSQYAGMKGVPAPTIAVLGSGLLLLIGSLTMITGFQPDIGAIALILFLLPVAFMMHNFWTIEDEMQKQGEMVNFMKNIALAGAAAMTLMIPEPWVMSLGG